ncbi:hypothetical protein L202_05510 [Cryptococcus amylolentus CBS 6039]|uniref:Ketoreductase (KR) domain-containing protein n=1 Tax=Cryptococcus amylolentus CBS 6039 TaxID=1295533 RepID=A0A1E3HKT2_9TREE|nr:hypothetical protein L202_05510 [Cryptococcus amylolentus CBS 6039]ODN76944.1 hypothetical protein L202_05510 [Cryptococcus amylolentus CBS 6039]
MSYWSTLWTWLSWRISTILHSGWTGIFWVQPHWGVDDIPDQTGKVALITGGNSGTGYATALALYNAGATVYIACRDLTRAQEAADDIVKGGDRGIWGVRYPKQGTQRSVKEKDVVTQLPIEDLAGAGLNGLWRAKHIRGAQFEKDNGQRTKGRIEIIQLDLADLASVDKCADEFLSKEKHIDLLYCNAGVMATNEGLYTKQGYTLQFGTNVLGHHRLITRLLPTLLQNGPQEPARVIITSSAGHGFAPPNGLDIPSLTRSPEDPPLPASSSSIIKASRGKYELEKWAAYGQSKWGDIALARWLEDTYGKQGRLISVAVHPGLIASNLANHLPGVGFILKLTAYAPWIVNVVTRSPATGALNQLYAGTIPLPFAWYLNGQYVVPFGVVGEMRPDLWDIKNVHQVWDWCVEQGKKFN